MARNFIYYSAFQLGESGLHSDFESGYRLFRGVLIYRGTYSGKNVRTNIDGTLGPRPGLWPVPVTGVPTGAVLGYGSTNYTGKTGWFVVGTTVYLFDHQGGGAVIACTGALASTPTAPVAGVQSGPSNLYLSSQGDKSYVVNLATNTVTAMANSPGGKVISLYNSRLVVANLGGTNTNRVVFSDPFAPGGNPQFAFQASLTYVDVGDALDVNFLAPQRTHLAIGKQDSWWVYQGEPGLNAVLRRSVNTDGPKEPANATLSRNGQLWYVPIFADLPASFNGSSIQQARNLRFAASAYVVSTLPPAFGVQTMVQPNDVFMVAGAANTGGANKFAEFHNGAWAFHNSGVPLSGYTGYGGGNGVYLCDGGAVGVAAKFFVYPTELDRPVKLGDTFGTTQDGATPGAGNTANATYVELPEWESRDGSEVVVRAVLVGFKKWNTGFTQSNHFDVNVISTRQFNKAGLAASGVPAQGQVAVTQSWDEAPSLTTSDGQYQEVALKVGDQITGNGFKLVFQNLRGVAIQKIQVIVDIEPTRV